MASEHPSQPRSAPKVMQTSASGTLNITTPTKSRRRPLNTPVQTSNTSSFQASNSIGNHNASSRIQKPRRASGYMFKNQQNSYSQIEGIQSPKIENKCNKGRSGCESEDERHDGDHLATDLEISATDEPNDSATSVTSLRTDSHSPIANRFRTYRKPWKIKTIISKVFWLMQQPLKEGNDFKDGYIYSYSIADHPGYMKIGFAGKEPNDRMNRIEKCLSTHELDYPDSTNFEVPNYKKLEKLIHAELQPYRRTLKCDKPRCSAGHNEWFEIDEAKAIEVIDRWKEWMNCNPYNSTRKLSATETLRIETFRKKNRLEQLIIRSDEADQPGEWDWDAFFQHSITKIDLLFYLMVRKRPEMVNPRSKGRSLQDNLKSNILLWALFYFVSIVVFWIAEQISSSTASAPGPAPAFVISVLLASIGILYAA